ncbi:MAG: radical SAM/SPASM domain-containing protein [Nitrospinota bacterium]
MEKQQMGQVKIINSYSGNTMSLAGKIKKIYQSDFRKTKKARLLICDMISFYLGVRRHELPGTIEVETVNRCNSSCSFCPVNVLDDPRKFAKMSDQFLEKIARELEEIQYSGSVALYANNEPLLDDRIVEVCRLFKKRVKNAVVYLSTNGIKINFKLFTGLFEAGLDELHIDNYNDDLKLIRPVSRLLDEVNRTNGPAIEEYKRKTTIALRKKTEVLDSRGGFAPNKLKEKVDTHKIYHNHSCPLPFMQFVIRSSGEISRCSHDALGKATLGNLHEQTIREVWNGVRYREVRKKLLKPMKFGRKSLEVCNGCDSTPIHIVRTVRKRNSLYRNHIE